MASPGVHQTAKEQQKLVWYDQNSGRLWLVYVPALSINLGAYSTVMHVCASVGMITSSAWSMIRATIPGLQKRIFIACETESAMTNEYDYVRFRV